MRTHLYSKLFDHHFILNGGYKIAALQKLPVAFFNFFIEDLIVLCEINDDSSMFLPTFSSLVGTVFCFCDWQEFYEPTLTLLQRGNN